MHYNNLTLNPNYYDINVLIFNTKELLLKTGHPSSGVIRSKFPQVAWLSLMIP